METPDRDLIETSLEAAAARTDDLTPAVYGRFLARQPQFAVLFPDELGRGRMLNEVLVTLTEIAEQRHYVEGSVASLAHDHRAYAEIPQQAYRDFCEALIDELAELLGEAWTAEVAAAWRRQTERLLEMIGRVT